MRSPIIRTHYSILQSFNKPESIVEACKEAGIDTCVLCDVGTLSASVEFLEACQKHGLKAVIGCDFNGTKIFAKNKAGWHKLVSLVTEWCCENRLGKTNDDVIVIKDKMVECRYAKKEHEEFYRIIRALGLKCKITEVTEQSSDFELKALDCSQFDCVEQFSITGPPKLPRFTTGDEVLLLRNMAEDGLKKLNLPQDKLPIYEKRLAYEMKVIEMANLAGYFLIVQDFVANARSDEQLCAVGRGSAAGSLVSYLVGITLIDPIPYGLLFSRFFNAARAYPKHLSFDEHPFIDEWRDYETKYA